MQDLVIETQTLSKRFGRILAVDSLSLQVPRGGVFGLLGPNGSGKTTTLSILLGLVRPTAGSVRLFGRDVNGSHQEALRRMGAIVETPAFYPYLSGRANLRFFQGISGHGSMKEVDRLLSMVKLSERANSRFSTYSLGMKQRLGIAYALLGEPELLLLDEPTNGLDPAGMAEVRDLVRELGTGGRTVVLSSHLLHEVEQVCDNVAILSKGRLIAQGRVKDLLAQRGGVRLKTTDDGKAEGVLKATGWAANVSRDGDHLNVAVPPERSWQLTKLLAEHSVFVAEMVPLQVSLESYFLEVTGEENGSAANRRPS
ncbi:MAG: ABC transporter ATP-binding protein [Chloroflexi bacterium]|nr:ABC transporter ATP-binding protein [Chloroflexota bacterium]